MFSRPHLSERYQNILRATIQHYIATAEPVGSKTLVEEYNFSVSSATIRNALLRLEKEGLLYQPHTSSGRVPSDSGYRMYVDDLLTFDERLNSQVEKYLNAHLGKDNKNLESLLQRTIQMLASLSGYIAIITLPQKSSSILRHLQLVAISPEQVMLIIVMDNYQTQSILMEINSIYEEELNILSNFLNQHLRGYSLADLAQLDWTKIDQEFIQYTNLLTTLIQEVKQSFQNNSNPPSLIIHGISEALRQPEFNQLQQVQMLLHLLEEEQEQLIPLIFEWSEAIAPTRRVRVKIGSENPLEPMHPCSLVSAVYCQKNLPAGSVGIIGPTRMLYENTISLVESTAEYLSAALS
jgi:heat-inducible transcriptional repressor